MIYNPLPHQQIFHESEAKYRLLGGSAGPGKSKALRMEAVNQCNCMPGIKGVILRRTFPELESSIIIPLLEELPKESYTYNSSKHYMTFPNDSMLFFMHCQYEKDVYRLQGAEFDFVGIDELTHFNEYLFQYILSRLRTSKEGIEPNFFAATNPGGVGHSFVKRLWVDRQHNENENPDDYHYIPAKVYDNPYLINNDPDYVRRLEQLPDKERRALLEGDWDAFQGQFFSEFRRDIHVVEPFIPRIENGYKEWIVAVDYGYAAPTAIVWMSIDNQKNVIIYREIYKTGLLYQDVAREIVDKTTKGENVKIAVFDPAVVNKKLEDSGKPAKQILYESGLSAAGIKIIPGNNNRIDGWNTARELIKVYKDINTGKPTARLKICSNCPDMIRTIPALIHDKTKIEDVDTTGEDHLADAGLRYGPMHLVGKGRYMADMAEVRKELTKQTPEPHQIIKKRIGYEQDTNLYDVRF